MARTLVRYEWMTAYAAAPDATGNPAHLEHRLLPTFADAFRVVRLGNAQSAWTDEGSEYYEAVSGTA